MNNFTYIAANIAEYYVGYRKHQKYFSKEDYMTNWDPVFMTTVLSDLSAYIKEGQLETDAVILNCLLGPAAGVFVDSAKFFEFDMTDNSNEPFPKTELDYLTNLVMQVEFMIFSVENTQFSASEICSSIIGFRSEIRKTINDVLIGKDPLEGMVFSLHDSVAKFMDELFSKGSDTIEWLSMINNDIQLIKQSIKKTWKYTQSMTSNNFGISKCIKCGKEVSKQDIYCTSCNALLKTKNTKYKNTVENNKTLKKSVDSTILLTIVFFILSEMLFNVGIFTGIGYSIIPCLLLLLPYKGIVKKKGTIVIGVVVLISHIGRVIADDNLLVTFMILSCVIYAIALYYAMSNSIE